jgi:flagellar assembly factor FliW
MTNMKSTLSTTTGTEPSAASNLVELPLGLLGFEQIKNYALLADPAEKPFAWLRVADNHSLAFVVVDPFVVLPEYKPDIPKADVEFLGLKDPSDVLLLGIVTIHAQNHATMNLKGPVVINRHSHVGKQVIIANAADYSVEHLLPLVEAVA